MGWVKSLRFKLGRKRVAADRVAEEEDGRDDTTAAFENCRSNGKWKRIVRLSWDDVERLTGNFSRVVGYGGFSTVYLAEFQDSSRAAVKIQGRSQRLYQAYKQELDILLRVGHHDNIVKLLGYCDDREEGVLIFEYLSNGNLQEKLHGSNTCLPWKTRMAIAFQLAGAIAYLHDNRSPQIVHGDIKASNILLDENLNCKLCDFGSAKMGFSSSVVPTADSNSRKCRNRAMMVGSPGYTDPLYLRTGLASKKNDVYSFGVVVLELITGLEALSPQSGERLTTTAAPMLKDVEKVAEMMDPRLRGEVDSEEARAMAALSAMCVGDSPGIRPSASDILAAMRGGVPSLSFLFQKKAP